jgi:ubiquinone/menaquinone biosynthesis C-methylase UbiE
MQPDFGYPWWLSYGHLGVTAAGVALILLGRARKWSGKWILLACAVTVWSVGAFAAVRFGFNASGRASLPTGKFLAAGGPAKVLDIGAGTGRSTLMVLESRPQTTVVALDLFAQSFKHHFGEKASGEDWLRGNLRAAGVEQRAEIRTGDMRELPFAAAEFDAIVSAYAIDHLPREGSSQALREAARVVKPGGEFLLMLVHKDKWMKMTFGPLLFHGGTRGVEWWSDELQKAGFEIVEQGTRPVTLYFLARKK